MGPSLTGTAQPPVPLHDSLASCLALSGYLLESAAAAEADVGISGSAQIGLNKLLTLEATIPSPIKDKTVLFKPLLYDSENSHHSYEGNTKT